MNKTLNNEIYRENLIRKRLKEEDLKNERIEDKQMIDDIVERERQIALAEAAEKERHKQETRDYLKNFKNRSNELKLNQDLLDKLLEEERNKQWKKRQDQWDKEEKARVNLLYDVYGDRARAIELRKREEEEEARRKEAERQEVTMEIKEYDQKVKRDELEEMLVSFFFYNFFIQFHSKKKVNSRYLKIIEKIIDDFFFVLY